MVGCAPTARAMRSATNRVVSQPLGVDIHQADGRIRQLGKAEDVAEQVLGEDGAACADKSNRRHGILLSEITKG